MVIKDGAKMSKSKGNVVDPDLMVERYGADTTRLFSLFAAPPERDLEWSEAGVEGCHRFLARVWRTFERVRPHLPPPGSAPPAGPFSGDALALRRKTHRTIRRVTEDLGPRMHLNTTVSSIMELINAATPLTEGELDAGARLALGESFAVLAKLLSPLAPHLAEEIWEALGGEGLVSRQAWPVADAALLEDEDALVVVQVNGKVRGRLTLPRGSSEEQALRAAGDDEKVAALLAGKTVRRVVFVPDRLLNVVVS
jgi:leucyl-tRNA synthetase